MRTPELAADIPECATRARFHTAARHHLCRLPAGHPGRHRCHACPHEWDAAPVLQPPAPA